MLLYAKNRICTCTGPNPMEHAAINSKARGGTWLENGYVCAMGASKYKRKLYKFSKIKGSKVYMWRIWYTQKSTYEECRVLKTPYHDDNSIQNTRDLILLNGKK